MLVRDDETSWLAIGQPAHAWLAGQIARHWAPALSPDAVLAVEQHDVAWVDWDRRPPLHAPARRAAAFFEAPADQRLAIWRDAPLKLVEQSPYAALLVSLHARNVHTRYGDPAQRPPEVETLLADQQALQDDLLRRTGASRVDAERDGDLLFALDALSLTLCHGWGGRDLPPTAEATLHLEPAGGEAWTLDPWPLDVPELTVGLAARRFTERFDDEAALHAALDAAPFVALRWTLRPA